MSLRHLNRLFQPGSVAVIGASTRPERAGAVVMRNLLAGGFDGPIMPVNPNRTHVAGVLCYPDIASLPLVPDLAVICSPSDTVAGQIVELGRRGVRAAIAITGAYGHGDEHQGPPLFDSIRHAATAAGVRLLGPNCLGLVVPGHRLNASFSHIDALPGKLGFVCRSAGLCGTVLDWARPKNIGFSACLSLGDCADIGYDDAIDYLARDPRTRAILLFIEDLQHRGNLLSALRAAARLKPVLCIKRPRITPAPGAPASVTAALATPDHVADAALRRAGVLRVDFLHELFGAVETLAAARPVRSERLTILTNNATLATIAIDDLLAARGELAVLSQPTLARLDQALPFAWSRTNPINLLIDADGPRYAAALRILLEDRDLDRILVVHAPSGVVSPEATAAAVIETVGKVGGNVVTSWVGDETAAAARQRFIRAGIPTYDTPARAARAFLQVLEHRRNQAMLIEMPPSIPTDFAPDLHRARAIIGRALADGRGTLDQVEAVAILSAYGLATAAPTAGLPPRPLILGLTTDAVFGPVILFGEGGDAAEVARDIAVALPPLNPPLARELMSRTRIHRTLAAGGDSAAPALAAINRALVRVSQMIIDLPEIVDLDLNPVEADARGLRILGVTLRAAVMTGEPHRRLAIRPYPRDLEETVTLRDGRSVLLRPIRPEDEPAHHTLIARLSPEDIRFRFFGFVRRLEHTQMARMTQIDYDREMAFVAVAPGPGPDDEPETLGVVDITDPDNAVAEFSMVVRSDLKGLGLGRELLGKMIRYARSRGTGELAGQVLPDNRDMLRLTRRLGFIPRMNTEEEVMDVRLPLMAP